MWRSEQQSLINGIKGKPVVIASDMRVDSRGHSGLLGSGSTFDVERNILRTHIIKIIGGQLWYNTRHVTNSSAEDNDIAIYQIN